LKLGLASSGLFFAGCGGGSDSPGTVNPSTVVPPLSDTPGALSRDKPSKRIIVIGAGAARLVAAYAPFVSTKHSDMNLVIVHENEEDLYAGIEHRQTEEVFQCLKLITRQGCERIVRYAFEYAKQQKRKRVTCFVKDNIMKLTDGLFHQVFRDIAAEYPEIQHDSMLIDIGAARVADTPEKFDVIVMPNLYGDIISDVAAQIAGSLGMAGSANIGDQCAMFEAIHGSAPDIAGQNIANPSALLHGAIQMLVHIGQNDIAEKIHHAWLLTLEKGLHTADVYREGNSQKLLGTSEFADQIIKRLGQSPAQLHAPSYADSILNIEIFLNIEAHLST
jgi:isocitrate dehydrogenase